MLRPFSQNIWFDRVGRKFVTAQYPKLESPLYACQLWPEDQEESFAEDKKGSRRLH